MALDTVQKRLSVLSIQSPWRRTRAPLASGGIDQADRQQLALLYSGILAGAPAVLVGERVIYGSVIANDIISGDVQANDIITGNVQAEK